MKSQTTAINTNSPLKPGKSEPNDNRIAWGAAIGVHLLLALIFAFLNVGWRYDIPEWVEMEFVSANRKSVAQKAQSRKQNVQRPEAAKPEPEKPDKAKEQEAPKNIINLPKRRMLEDEKPLIRAKRRLELTADKEVSGAWQRKQGDRKPDFDVLRSQKEGTGKSMAELKNLDIGEKAIQAGTPDLGKSMAVPFQIEGEAANRTVLQKVIPQYPSGLAREAVVKLSFTVLPNGVVANVVPVLKGDAILEKIAIDAFRQWRFNELPADLAQQNQRGVITFRFVLR